MRNVCGVRSDFCRGANRACDGTTARFARRQGREGAADLRATGKTRRHSIFDRQRFSAIYDEDGVLVGFNVDLARAICLELATSCDIKARPWEELLIGLNKGEADAVIAAHKVTAAATATADFTDRYFHTPGRFAGQKSAKDVDISPAGLDGKRIAVARGSAHEAYLKTFFRDSPLALFENADLAREALAAGKADYVFDDGISLAFWLNGTLSRQCCEMKGGPFLEPKFFGDGLAIAVPKGDPEVRRLLNDALKRVRASGRFEELVQRYFPVRIY